MYHLPRSSTNETIYSPYGSAGSAAGAEVVNRSSVAALAFLLWDILITMEDEVNLIWPRTLSYTKVVYFLIRYIPVFVHISILFVGTELTPYFNFTPYDCYIWQIFQGVAVVTIVTLVDTILILRIHALYHGNNVMRIIVFICFGLEIIGMTIGLIISLPKITYDHICLTLSFPHSIILYGASSIAFQTFLFIITLYKFIQAARSGWGDVPLIVLLVRDGTWAFFMLFAIYAGQGFVFLLSNKAYSGVLYAWILTAFSFAGYRILLNISKLADYTSDGHSRTSNGRRTDTNIQFTTQLFESQAVPTQHHDQTDFLEPSMTGRHQQRRGRDLEHSRISTFSLEP
ncbi:hypothetical protein CVT24_003354 [Panaeolus cyanescens]|uniref:DUF6533 domain-containing protein n=1 Tax=Panaeolus cyanescens TaxID=181874 RepID=A0A409Y6Y8_9AGAR|nr:hypothetical protein CVT24_003354 [Panaeolus cyanescens]